jgi:hypothetical protein
MFLWEPRCFCRSPDICLWEPRPRGDGWWSADLSSRRGRRSHKAPLPQRSDGPVGAPMFVCGSPALGAMAGGLRTPHRGGGAAPTKIHSHKAPLPQRSAPTKIRSHKDPLPQRSAPTKIRSHKATLPPNHADNLSSSAPSATWSPGAYSNSATVPSWGALMVCSIFMASITAKG